jgi:hypothetical protein
MFEKYNNKKNIGCALKIEWYQNRHSITHEKYRPKHTVVT